MKHEQLNQFLKRIMITPILEKIKPPTLVTNIKNVNAIRERKRRT